MLSGVHPPWLRDSLETKQEESKLQAEPDLRVLTLALCELVEVSKRKLCMMQDEAVDLQERMAAERDRLMSLCELAEMAAGGLSGG